MGVLVAVPAARDRSDVFMIRKAALWLVSYAWAISLFIAVIALAHSVTVLTNSRNEMERSVQNLRESRVELQHSILELRVSTRISCRDRNEIRVVIRQIIAGAVEAGRASNDPEYARRFETVAASAQPALQAEKC